MPYYMNEVHPDYTAASGLLQHLSNDELKRLLNEDQELDGMAKDLEQVKNIEAERVMLLASNKNLAEFNLNREPSMLETRQRLAHMYSEALELKKEVEEKKQKLDEKGRQVSLDTTLAILQTSAAQSEEETEEMADKLLNGDIPVEEFIEKYLEKRKIAHLRKVKAEKMAELLAQKRNQSISMFSSSHFQAGNRPSRLPPAPPFYPNPPMGQPLYGPGVLTPPSYGISPVMRMPMPSYR
ncbi:vacuolar protein sorting-associated protein 37B-like [Limulus polyphemus]|uniref:Vacuolar protein sorting-associated protein 37B-like n=1 Tax=Limulus polyphemus TaxID=6850 RepID=A0ABM1B127_LIMPO|nr:vacuolar protein sorting-associated protein 37B-like [Limulus polyphemus]XP_013772614.1 vacuolar protein sorting-associated protein 37B-like [Limulus polyphemus]XP_022239426.1 vacuolar protein sorting-associated protein 37B-like [Limulus polyphemus]XP_022239427.1 vacuolar protein sorting-associated protein 37B-like [Limulus polyphemus]